MKVTDIIRRAGRNLRRAKMRTALTSVAIAVGGLAIMISLMAGEGARQYVERVLSSNIDPNGLTIAKDEKLTSVQVNTGAADLREYNPDAALYHGQEYNTLTADDIAKLRARSDIENVEPMYQFQPKYVAFSAVDNKKYVANVTMRDTSLRMDTIGRPMDSGSKLADNETIVPESYAQKLGISDVNKLIGSTVTITIEQSPQEVSQEQIMQAFAERGEAGVQELTQSKVMNKEFTIVSLAKKTADQMSAPASIYISASAAKSMNEFTTEGTDMHQKYLFATATAKGDAEEVKQALKNDGYPSMSSKDIQGVLFTFVNTLQTVVLGFGVLALVVSVFGVVNTMYISVLERTQQIGLMKALGAGGRDIGRLFRYEAAWVGFLGGAMGVLVAWGISVVLNPVISQALNFGSNSLLIFQPLNGLAVIAALILVAIVAGWLPSRKAAKLDPIEALRTE